ncbi:hypothetical protein ACFTSF_40725 [Kribbella sp. NPDC056951]|uniref:hypothetical protein n=1 Tax=Kribbella sp. NPDC056951 TaxID=3345978 RepID=UPI00363E3392
MSEGGEQASALTVSRVLRGLFDFNTMYEGEGKRWWAWWIARIALFGIGRFVGGMFWELTTGEPADQRSFLEQILTNAYIWATLLTSGVLALVSGSKNRR